MVTHDHTDACAGRLDCACAEHTAKRDRTALDRIAVLLRAPEWDSGADYLEAIHEMVTGTGRSLSHETPCRGCGLGGWHDGTCSALGIVDDAHRRRAGGPPSRRRGRSRVTAPDDQLALDAEPSTSQSQQASDSQPAPPLAPATIPPPAGWPEPPAAAAYHGVCGEIVSKLAPETEADPVAILAQLLVAAGSVIGRGAFFQVEATLHHPNEFLVLVGDSSKARIWCARHIRAYGAPQTMLR